MNKNNIVYLKHIQDALEKIEEFIIGINKKEFFENDLVQSAVIRKLEIVGEDSNKVSQEFRNKHDNFPWSQMVGMRNKLIHDYFGVDLEIVLETIKKDVPKLKTKVDKLLDK